jgi:uncharacterized NAD(P)/FAD-binding protein YdhS
VVTFIRHLAPELWRTLPLAERRRFLRHAQSYWDIHRHRLPPRMAQRIDHMRRSGRLQIDAGRIRQLVPEGNALRVIWRRRGSSENESFAVDAVINATGPDYAVMRSADPLFRSLREQGRSVEPRPVLSRPDAARRSLGSDGGARAARPCRAACEAFGGVRLEDGRALKRLTA